MKKTRDLTALILLLPAIGCGAVPDFVLNEIRDSAKVAVEQQIDAFVDEAVGGLLDDFELPTDLLGDEEAADDQEAVDDEQAVDEEPDRTTR